MATRDLDRSSSDLSTMAYPVNETARMRLFLFRGVREALRERSKTKDARGQPEEVREQPKEVQVLGRSSEPSNSFSRRLRRE